MWPGLRPSTMMRSASSTASSMLCVTRKTALVGMVFFAHSSSSSLRRFSAVSTSSAENGSSMKSTSGSTTRARAKPTRCSHAAGELLGIGGFKAVQADRVEHLHAAFAALGGLHAACLQRSFDVFEHRKPGKQSKALKDDGDVDLGLGDGLSVPVDLPCRGRREPGQHAQHG